MNAGQLNINPDTGEVEEEMDATTHTYNHRPRPTKKNQKYDMTTIWTSINYCQATPMSNIKPRGHKGRHKKIRREWQWLNQLHERKALLL